MRTSRLHPKCLFKRKLIWFGSASGDPGTYTPTGPNNAYTINYVRAWRLK